MLRRREQACVAGGIAILGWAAIGEAMRQTAEVARPSKGCDRRVTDDTLGVRCARITEPEQDLPGPVAIALGARIDVNNASAGDLEAIPGLGAGTAAAIVWHRKVAGPFTEVEQLRRIKGIGPATLKAIRPYVRAGPGIW